jgi:hypothetical protein
VYEEGFELAKEIRSELFGYIGKAAVAGVALFIGTIATILWAYFEWRLPQIAGGVPKNAVLIFNKEHCPTGWQPLDGSEMRVIAVAAQRKDGDENKHPRPLYFNGSTRHAYGEYRLVKAPSDVRLLREDEEHVIVPGLLALNFCEKVHD